MRWLWWVGAPVLAGMLLFLAVRDVVPAYTAQFGSGVTGVFTATEHDCGGRSCSWVGYFTAGDGSAPPRRVTLSTGGDLERVGDAIPAVDTGNPYTVYPATGSADWLLITILGAASIVTLGVWLRGVIRAIRRTCGA
ncbi:hypothetical protein E1267_40795 [Nonomuraea longispora]|uniref:DUF3592 domain-containing protein n=1 Tax=Nonomuraea longispora TaxID=1848320 RepID=A0A4R4ML76_9ACTN|nr:hypothetical protein [Nonomuraea longispora]TDB96634.1 hypothetical protein E1267_40795 [Nonomuraea longispora]